MNKRTLDGIRMVIMLYIKNIKIIMILNKMLIIVIKIIIIRIRMIMEMENVKIINKEITI
jgi:hypothetical protein